MSKRTKAQIKSQVEALAAMGINPIDLIVGAIDYPATEQQIADLEGQWGSKLVSVALKRKTAEANKIKAIARRMRPVKTGEHGVLEQLMLAGWWGVNAAYHEISSGTDRCPLTADGAWPYRVVDYLALVKHPKGAVSCGRSIEGMAKALNGCRVGTYLGKAINLSLRLDALSGSRKRKTGK